MSCQFAEVRVRKESSPPLKQTLLPDKGETEAQCERAPHDPAAPPTPATASQSATRKILLP